MKCNECKFVFADTKDVCPSCRVDVRPRKKMLELPISNPKATLRELIDGLPKNEELNKNRQEEKKKKKKRKPFSLKAALENMVFETIEIKQKVEKIAKTESKPEPAVNRAESVTKPEPVTNTSELSLGDSSDPIPKTNKVVNKTEITTTPPEEPTPQEDNSASFEETELTSELWKSLEENLIETTAELENVQALTVEQDQSIDELFEIIEERIN